MLSKRQRHQLIRRLVREGRIGTQVELVWALQGFGCEVTQATISRDVRELGLERRRDEFGRLHYVPPDHEERRDPEVTCSHMLGEFATEVVRRTEPGSTEVRGRHGTGSGSGDRRPRSSPDPRLRRRRRHRSHRDSRCGRCRHLGRVSHQARRLIPCPHEPAYSPTPGGSTPRL